jgi:arylacetamide deacetylase-like 3/4
VTKYVIENPNEFSADPARIVLAGDSSGGSAVAVITQRFQREKLPLPRLQVHIYPWLQSVTSKLPSCVHYSDKGFGVASKLNFENLVLWYLGLTNITKQMLDVFGNDEIISSIENGDQTRSKILSLLDTEKIPEKYKIGKSYYEKAANSFETPKRPSETSILKTDKKMADLFSKVLEPAFSPLLASKEQLKGLPKAYIIVVEWDIYKDEGLLYAEHLRAAGVEVEVAFYEKAFHAIYSGGFKEIFPVVVEMENALIQFLESNL